LNDARPLVWEPSEIGKDIWRPIKQKLKESIDRVSFDAFFRDAVFSRVMDGVLFVLVPHESVVVGFDKFAKRIQSLLPEGVSGIKPLCPPCTTGEVNPEQA
jgi:hypothetical protein